MFTFFQKKKMMILPTVGKKFLSRYSKQTYYKDGLTKMILYMWYVMKPKWHKKDTQTRVVRILHQYDSHPHLLAKAVWTGYLIVIVKLIESSGHIGKNRLFRCLPSSRSLPWRDW